MIISGPAVLRIILKDLRSNVAWGSTSIVDIIIGVNFNGHAKVDDFYISSSLDKNVCRLEVSMHNSFGTKVTQSFKNRIDHFLDIFFRERVS